MAGPVTSDLFVYHINHDSVDPSELLKRMVTYLEQFSFSIFKPLASYPVTSGPAMLPSAKY